MKEQQPEEMNLPESEIERLKERIKAKELGTETLTSDPEKPAIPYSEFRKQYERIYKRKLKRSSMRKLYRIYLKDLKS